MERGHDNPVEIGSELIESGGSQSSQTRVTVEDLFHQFSDQLKRYGIGLGFPPEEAEEAVQEGFLRLQSAFSRHETVHHPGAFLYTVVRHVLIDSARLKVRFDCYEGQDSAPRDQVGRTSGASSRDLLRLAAALLTPRENEVFRMRWSGRTYREISSELGISSGTVGALASRAVAKVRRFVRDTG